MNTNVMIVDDEFAIRTAVSELFTAEGFEVTAASGCGECMEALDSGFKGVILMDIMMPDKDGWDTIREIADHGYTDGNIIFMLTARDTPDQKMEGLQEHIIDYVQKPFEPEELVATVQGYLELL